MAWRTVGRCLAAGILVAAAACGSSGESGQTDTTTATSLAPTTTIKTATVGQIASIVAKHNSDLRRYAASAKTCQIPQDPRCDLAAKLNITTLDLTASTLDVNLRAAVDDRPNNQLFIGAYPAELVGLVAATRKAIADVGTASKGLSNGGCSAPTPPAPCNDLYRQMGFAASDLVRQLDAWAPYL
jgi:hypothetical protein